MRITRAQPGDAAALTRIAFEAKRHWGYPESWIRRWGEVLTITPEYLRANPAYVASIGQDRVGFYALRLNGEEAILDHLWVIPDRVRKGIGEALFRHGEAIAAQGGAAMLRIGSDPNAEGFYRAMGALTVGRQPAPIDGVERFLPQLEKSLAPHLRKGPARGTPA